MNQSTGTIGKVMGKATGKNGNIGTASAIAKLGTLSIGVLPHSTVGRLCGKRQPPFIRCLGSNTSQLTMPTVPADCW